MGHEFALYDVELVVEQINGDCTCSMEVGDKIAFCGGKLSLPANPDFCLYALQSALPLIPAKQRQNHPNDWMETDNQVSCPDPACGLIMRIERVKQTVFDHDEVSATKLSDSDQ